MRAVQVHRIETEHQVPGPDFEAAGRPCVWPGEWAGWGEKPLGVGILSWGAGSWSHILHSLPIPR